MSRSLEGWEREEQKKPGVQDRIGLRYPYEHESSQRSGDNLFRCLSIACMLTDSCVDNPVSIAARLPNGKSGGNNLDLSKSPFCCNILHSSDQVRGSIECVPIAPIREWPIDQTVKPRVNYVSSVSTACHWIRPSRVRTIP